jgi:hypothetical protein
MEMLENKIDDEVNLETRKQFPLSFQDRQRLRKIVKKVHLKFLPEEFLTDKEADKMIESLGPSVREKLLVEHIAKVK